MTLRLVPAILLATAAAMPATAPAAPQQARATAGEIVVVAKFERLSGKTVTYSSPKGRYSATWIGTRRYRLSGTIAGRRLRGTIRTRQAASGTRYIALGSGTLGARKVAISGGGPNSLRTATLILTWPA